MFRETNKHPLLAVLLLMSGFVVATSSLEAQEHNAAQPIAKVGEQSIQEEDLLPLIGAQLLQLRNQEYELKFKALTTLINRRVLEEYARREGIPSDKYLEQKVDRNLPQPAAGEIEAYYFAQKDRLNRPLEEVRPQLEQALIQAKRQQARQEYMDRLQTEANVSILLNRPRVEIAPDPERLEGSADAPVTIIEFADYECPFCQEARQTVSTVMRKYKGQVRLGFRDFPLRQIHQRAEQAAEASRCAAEQGKFWQYHDRLYANQTRLDPDALREHARATGLDLEPFENCLTSGKFVAAIESDLQAGVRAGVSATPTFYVNGVPLIGVQTVGAFEKIIDSELAAAAGKTPPQ
jgi:protein-disulfide isomerase